MDTYLVRIKPRDPHRGHVLRRFVYRGIKFEVGKGWYRVSTEIGEYLKTVHQQPLNPHSPPAFDVCTDAEAEAIDKQEAEAAKPARPADRARVVTARDEEPQTAGDGKGAGSKGGRRGRSKEADK